MKPVIRLEHIEKVFTDGKEDFEALRDVSLEVNEGDIFGIIGLSGAGKSTLVRCLNLLERPTSGKVYVNDKDMMTLSEPEIRRCRQKIGMVFQHFNLLMQRTVLGNVCFPLEIVGMSRKDAKKRAMEVLKLVGIADQGKRLSLAALGRAEAARSDCARACQRPGNHPLRRGDECARPHDDRVDSLAAADDQPDAEHYDCRHYA